METLSESTVHTLSPNVRRESAEKTMAPVVSHAANDWERVNLYKFVALQGSISLLENVVFYPLELCKTRLQMRDNLSVKSSPGAPRATLWNEFRLACSPQQGGVRGLYNGFWWSTLGTLPSWVGYFVAYNTFKDALLRTEFGRENTSLVHLASGALADVASVTLFVPADIVSQRLQYGSGARGIDIVRSIAQTEGIRGFYRGWLTTAVLYAPGSAVWWASYEKAKLYAESLLPLPAVSESALVRTSEGDGVYAWARQHLVHMTAGVAAGVCTVALTNPIDVVKTRLQTETKAQKVYDIFQTLWRNEGVRGLFKGILPRMMYYAGGSAVTFTTYEWIKNVSKKD